MTERMGVGLGGDRNPLGLKCSLLLYPLKEQAKVGLVVNKFYSVLEVTSSSIANTVETIKC